MPDVSLIHARGLTKRFGDFTAVDGIDFDVAARRGVRLPRPERRRQEQHHAHDRLRLAAHRRHAADPRPRPGDRRAGHPGAARRGAPGGHARPRADRAGEPADLRPLLRPAREPSSASGPTSCSTSSSSPSGPTAKVDPLSGGMKRRLTIARCADQRARAAAARRADHRPRPAGPPRPVGPAVPAEAAGRHARADHALHGRGRAALRPAGRDGRRPHRRRGLAPPASSSSTPTREVLELRFGPDEHEAVAEQGGRPGRAASRCCPTGSCSTPTTARRRSPEVHERGLRPESALVRRSTLEDVFLRLTGRTLVD